MLLLVSGASTTVKKHAESENIGCLLTPRNGNTVESFGELPWAADNDCFNGFDETRFRQMLKKIQGGKPLFVSCPDVVADAQATMDMFNVWEAIIHAHGFPVALVIQDGQENLDMPWGRCEALFIGGTTEFKLGDKVRWLVREAKFRGKWVHMGRVNSNKRLEYARDIGCDSADGSGYSKFPDANIPPALSFLKHEQISIGFDEAI